MIQSNENRMTRYFCRAKKMPATQMAESMNVSLSLLGSYPVSGITISVPIGGHKGSKVAKNFLFLLI